VWANFGGDDFTSFFQYTLKRVYDNDTTFISVLMKVPMVFLMRLRDEMQ